MPDIIKEAQGHPALTLRYKGIVDYNGLSTYVIKWLLDRNYKINEKVHKQKMSCPHGFDIDRQIEAYRNITEYYRYKIGVFFRLLDAFEVDAVKNGKKVKLWNARIEVQLHFDIVCDYADKWGKNPFYEKLRNFFDQYIIKKEIIIKHADPVYYRLLGLHADLKKFLEMETATKFQ
jgi:hypothetical protein